TSGAMAENRLVELTEKVTTLRREARERALARPRHPFDGTVRDETRDGVGLRRYVPDGHGSRREPASAVVFLHGGYGMFGDLELQDASCRRVATALGTPVVSVDYRLAPEGSLAEAAGDALVALALLAAEGVG